jgi:hypothetical protein
LTDAGREELEDEGALALEEETVYWSGKSEV